MHPDKIRLIEFGRFAAENRKRRGQSKPENFDDKALLAKAAELKAKTDEEQRDAAIAAKQFKPPPKEKDEAKDAAADAPAWIKQLPQERRERALQRWREATPEERKKMERRRAQGGGRRPGGSSRPESE